MDEREAVGLLPGHLVGQVVSTDLLRELGLSRGQIECLIRRGRLRPVRRGWFRLHPGGTPRPEDEHRAQVLAAVGEARRHGRNLVLAGVSAAAWWGLPWLGPAGRAVVVCGRGRSGSSKGDLLRRLPTPPAQFLTTHKGVRVTDVARTVADVARTSEPRWALAVADAAMHRGLAGLAGLEIATASVAGLRQAGRARWCLAHADIRSESPGESISRCAMILAGIPLPDLQVVIRLPSGATARVDFRWEADRLVGEFDGMVKYGVQAPGRTPQEALVAEKLREDQLRAAGYRVTRWTWQDAWSPGPWLGHLRALLPRSAAAA